MLFQTKCVMEEINRNTLVVGEFASYHKDNSAQMVPMDIKVTALSSHQQRVDSAFCVQRIPMCCCNQVICCRDCNAVKENRVSRTCCAGRRSIGVRLV